ncbi:MAG: serine/threonine protein kinase [Kofleriaceae bacterium]
MANRTLATDRRAPVRIAAMLASPLGVLLTIPLLVIAVGLAIILLGRSTTRDASLSMARHQLAEQANAVQNDVAFALDQADPLLGRLRVLADRTRSTDEVLVRLHDLMIGRPGVAFVSISFPDGTFRGAQLTGTKIEVQESHAETGTVTWFEVDDDLIVPKRSEHTHYDPRTRAFYQLAAQGSRAWTAPYTFFKSHETGITCTEPVFDASKALAAVITVDFDVGALSAFIARPALDQARSAVYTRDGAILASPLATKLPITGDKLLQGADLHDPAIDALFAAPGPTGMRELATRDGTYLASVAAIGGKRAGVLVPLDWYVATVVPARTLLGPTHRLERGGVIASAGALAIAVMLGLVLAWNVVRMRRQVATARSAARSAEARARELGSYRLVARLGAGGMGEVWRAEHRLLAREAAIKLIRAEVLQSPDGIEEVRERFRREAQVLASMKSRHTIDIFDYGVTEAGVFYYVMELLDGLDLESLVVRYGPQPAARVIQLLSQACASLAEAHDANLLHRDIKPPNLFACRAADEVDICKLLDFGIVQRFDEAPASPPLRPLRSSKPIIETPKLTQVGAMLGTPGFMAPEQILGMQLDGRADLYALGCVAFWMLTGQEVFARAAEQKLLHKHIYDPAPSLSAAMTTWCPPELEALITSCLEKDPAGRPTSARVLGTALRRIEIPAEYAWTPQRAFAWWRDYRAPVPAPNVPSGEVQVIMPGKNTVQSGTTPFEVTRVGPGES